MHHNVCPKYRGKARRAAESENPGTLGVQTWQIVRTSLSSHTTTVILVRRLPDYDLTMRIISSALIAVGMIALTACSAPAPSRGSNQAPTSTASAACPYSGTERQDVPGCAMYDGEAAMRQNEAYRQRIPLAPGAQENLDVAADAARSALAAIVDEPASSAQVQKALTRVGLDFVETLDSARV